MSVVLIKNDDDDDSSLRTDSADFTTGPFLLSISVLYLFQFLHYSLLFGSVRQTKLATRQLLGAR